MSRTWFFERQVALVVCLAAVALAQNNSGRITGTVADHSGAVVPGASISVTNQETKAVSKTTTDANGYYQAVNLAVGLYSVEAEAQGFRKAARTGYDLTDNGRITADFKLEVGNVSESVTVTEVIGETVNTVSGELGRTIDSEQVQDLALNGRNYMQLVSLIPGVALLDEDQMATTTNLSITRQSVNGGRTDSNHLAVDGGMNMDSGSNGSQINNVGVDFIREMKVQTSAMSAEYGRNSGASINAVTKSGGTQFHGGLLYTIRNDALDAKDYFAPQKPMLRFHDYGWNLGGPVAFGPLKKGKVFFFAGEEWKTIRRFTSPTRRTLPTLQELDGNFSDRTNTIRYPGTTTPIPNKDLRPLMTAEGKAIMNLYRAMIPRAALYTDRPISNNATYQVYNPFNWRQDIVRVDYRANDHHNFYFRWLHDNYDLIDPFGTFNASQVPNTPTYRNRPGYGPQFGHLWTVSPSIINEAKFNASWNGQRTPLLGDDWKRETFGFTFPRVFGGNGKYSNGIPDITVNSFASINGPATVYLMSPTTDLSASDAVTYMRGGQTIKAGFMVVRNRKDQNGRAPYNGDVTFNTSPNNNTTNYALADVITGNYSNYNEQSSDPVGFFRFTQYEAFVQNDWRVWRRLTINLGLRYSHFVPTYVQANNITNWLADRYNPAQAVTVTTTGGVVSNSGNRFNGLVRAGDGIPQDQAGRVTGVTAEQLAAIPTGAPRGFYPAYNLWMPRFGFAWVPFARDKMVLRGGFGAFHDRVQGNMVFSLVNTPPFSQSVSYESGNLGQPSSGTSAAQTVLGTVTAIDPDLKVPLIYNYNLGIQRELAKGFFLDLSYAGNVGHHLTRNPDINYPTFAALTTNYALSPRPSVNYIRPYKGFSAIRMFLSDSNSNYNALQTYVTRRKGNAVMTLSYTWSHSLSDTSNYNDNADSGLGWTDRRFFYGPTSYDRRHLFVFTYTYRIPFLQRRKGLLGGALGRWEISGVTRHQSGTPLTPVGSATGVTRRANYVGGEVDLPSDERTPNHYFNTAAFKTASNTAIGTAGVGIIRGPGLDLWDVSVRKQFKLNERGWLLRFQADAFNLMNHVNFRSLSVTTSNTDFGSFTASGPARNLQGGLRFTF